VNSRDNLSLTVNCATSNTTITFVVGVVEIRELRIGLVKSLLRNHGLFLSTYKPAEFALGIAMLCRQRL